MSRKWLPIGGLILLVASVGAGAQQPSPPPVAPPAPAQQPRRPRATPAPSADSQLRPLVERYFTAWSTRNPDRPASLYALDPGMIFYDLIGAPYLGWDDYKQGRTAFFAEFTSVQLVPNPDLQARIRGTVGWTTVSFRATAVKKGGESIRLEGRHTAVWERRGTDWLIVHEHLSVPLADVAALTERFVPAIGESQVRDAVTAIVDQYEQAWNRGDASALGNLWDENGDIVTLGAGGVTRGRSAVAKLWADAIARRPAGSTTTLDTSVGDVRILGRGIALADGTFDYWRGAARTGPPAAQERFTSVLTLIDAQWRIVSMRVGVVAPPRKK